MLGYFLEKRIGLSFPEIIKTMPVNKISTWYAWQQKVHLMPRESLIENESVKLCVSYLILYIAQKIP